MGAVKSFLNTVLTDIVEVVSPITVLFGLIVLIYTSVTCFIGWVQKRENVKLMLDIGTSEALGFLLVGEILHTVVVHSKEDLIVLGATVVLRGAITMLLHKEISIEKEEERIKEEEKAQKK